MKYNNNRNKSGGGIVAVVAIIVFVLGAVVMLGRSSGGGQTAAALTGMVGKPAPAFSLTDRNGTVYTNDSLKGKKVVLFFNEGIMCYPACWNEMYSLSRDPRLQRSDIVVLSVVADSKSAWDSAIGKMPELAAARMVFDEDKSASRAFNVLTLPSSMHYGSLPGHTYVVIDPSGKVAYTYDDPRMASNGNLIVQELQKI